MGKGNPERRVIGRKPSPVTGELCEGDAMLQGFDKMFDEMGASRAALFLVGIGSFWAWIHATVTAPVFASPDSGYGIFALSNGCMVATLVVIGLIGRERAVRGRLRSLMVFAAALACAGTVCLGSAFLVDGLIDVLRVIGTVMTAVATAGLIALWGEGFVRFGGTSALKYLALAALAVSFFLFLLVSAFPGWVSLAVVSFLPAVSVLCLNRALADGFLLRREDGSRESRQISALTMGVLVKQKSFRRILLYIFAFSVPLNFLNMRIAENPPAGAPPDWMLVFASLLLVLAFVTVAEAFANRRNTSILSILIAVLATGALLAYLFVDHVSSTVLNTCMYAGYYLFLASFFFYLGSYAQQFSYPAYLVFVLGNASNSLGLLAGSAIGLVVSRFLDPFSAIVTIAIVYAVFLVGFLVLPEARMVNFDMTSRVLKHGPAEPAEPGDMVGSIRTQSHEAARAFGLSSREEEVLSYLLRGRSLASIGAELFISLNTVKTHVNHLYKKLDVHTREELMKRVEDLRE